MSIDQGFPAGTRVIARVVCLASLLFAGCTERQSSDSTGTSEDGTELRPSADVRGGESNSAVILGSRTLLEGDGGNGGFLRLTSSTGEIAVRRDAIVTTPLVPGFIGTGIDIGPDEERMVAGSIEVDWLRVQSGGLLRLREDTIIIVSGPVQIDGRIDGQGDKHDIDGRDLTIFADGVVNITGSVDASGREENPDKLSPLERLESTGGSGGEVFITTSLAASGAGPQMFISGKVLSDGGDTFSTHPNTAFPGRGGQVFLGATQGDLVINGRVTARGGKCYFTSGGNEATGGSIQLVAFGDLFFGNVIELNANGGGSSGNQAGNGGEIIFDGGLGRVTLDECNVECRGGRSLFAALGAAGRGGEVTITAATVDLTGVTVRATGGNPSRERRGTGGDGGTIVVAASTSMVVDQDVLLNANGGNTNAPGTAAGAGGAFKLLNLDESDPTVVNFLGTATVEGGKSAFGVRGSDGTVCISGVSSTSTSGLRILGTNNFPLAACGEDDVEDLVLHDLDCDDATATPESITTTLPVLVGIDFYRVLVDTGPGVVNTLTVGTSGEAGHNLDLFVGPESALGSTDPADYTGGSGTETTSTESVDVDLSTLPAGSFVAVWVAEQSSTVELYTITVSCSD